jgi:hypothetical protein
MVPTTRSIAGPVSPNPLIGTSHYNEDAWKKILLAISPVVM